MEKNISKEAWEDVAKEFIAARELRAFNEGMLHIMNNKYALRDYFAAKVMQGMCANPNENFVDCSAIGLAEMAYMHADAMLKVRGSNGQT
jgi:hypothetical protein